MSTFFLHGQLILKISFLNMSNLFRDLIFNKGILYHIRHYQDILLTCVDLGMLDYFTPRNSFFLYFSIEF